MSIAASGLAERAAELRSTFDRAFAVPLRAEGAAKTDLIAIRVGSEPCAIRLTDIAGLFADRKITRVPSGKSALLGIAGFRGALVPAYSLGILLGLSGTQAPRWLVIATAAPVALAFDAFEGHLRASADAILPRQSHRQMHGFAPSFIRAGALVRPVIDLASVVAALGTPAAESAKPNKE
jgi:chemotaxis signal transduction protein